MLVGGGPNLFVAAGKGFVPFGTDDPTPAASAAAATRLAIVVPWPVAE